MSGTNRTVVVNVVGDASGLTKTMGTAADDSESSGHRIGTAFSGAFNVIANSSNGALGPLQQVIGNVGQAMQGMSDKGVSLGEKMVGVGGGIAAAGAGLELFGSKDQAAQQQLAQSIKSTGGSFDEYKGQIDAAIKSGEKFGYTSSVTQNALSTLVLSTHSTSKALGDMTAVENLAAAEHTSLTTAASQYAKMLTTGTGKALTTFGITTADVTKKMADSNGTMTKGQAAAALLAQAVAGQASAAANTFSGRLDALKAKVEDTVASLGQKFGPALTGIGATMSVTGSLVTAGSAIIGHFTQTTEELSDAQKAAAAAQKALTATEGLGQIAEDGEAASAALEDTALGTEDVAYGITDAAEAVSLAPILLIIASVALLGVGIYELATHWKTVWKDIKAVVGDAWSYIDSDFVHPVESFFSAIASFIQQHWQLILAIITGPVGLAVLFIKDHLGQIEGFATDAVDGVERVWDKIASILSGGVKTAVTDVENDFGAIISYFAGFGSKMASIGTGMWSWIAGAFESAVNDVISLWNQLHFDIPSISVFGHHIGGGSIGVPQIPYLAEGGIVNSPTLAMIGEAGPEAVVPLSGSNAFGGGSVQVVVPINLDGRQIGQVVTPLVRTNLLQTRQNRNMTGLA
jgi:phage-related protein